MLTPELESETLTIMRRRAPWLATILELMLGGDPWQEGLYAKEILEGYRKHELHLET